MSYLCDAAGIKNYVVTGTDKDGNSHAWNKIFVDGEWYNADCTWDDPRLKYENPDYIRHDYLFVPDPEIVGITHFPDESLFTPLPCTASDDNYFIKEGLYFSNADDGIASLSEQIHDLGLSGQREAEIRFGNPDVRRMEIRLIKVKISVGMIEMSVRIYQHKRKIRESPYRFF